LLEQRRIALVEDKEVATTELLHHAHQVCHLLFKSDKIAGFLAKNRLVCVRGPIFANGEATRTLASYRLVCTIAVSMVCVSRAWMRERVTSCIAIGLTSGVARKGRARHGVDCSVHLTATRAVVGWHTWSWRRRRWWSTDKERLTGRRMLTA
jgi:hypothetical protein